MNTTGDLWRHLGLYTYTQQSFKEAMALKLSPSSKLLSELMFAVNKVNYNQGNNINALAGIGETSRLLYSSALICRRREASVSFFYYCYCHVIYERAVSMCPLITGDVFSLTTGWTSILKVEE